MMTSFKTRNLIAVLFTGFVNYWEWTVLLASIYPYIASVSQTLNCPDSQRLLYKLSADQPPKYHGFWENLVSHPSPADRRAVTGLPRRSMIEVKVILSYEATKAFATKAQKNI